MVQVSNENDIAMIAEVGKWYSQSAWVGTLIGGQGAGRVYLILRYSFLGAQPPWPRELTRYRGFVWLDRVRLGLLSPEAYSLSPYSHTRAAGWLTRMFGAGWIHTKPYADLAIVLGGVVSWSSSGVSGCSYTIHVLFPWMYHVYQLRSV